MSARFFVTAALAWVETEGQAELLARPRIEVDSASGQITAITAITAGHPPEPEPEPDAIVYDLGRALILPGMVNGHSHAFQRAIRGATQRRGRGDPSSFWSWRTAMYEAANSLEPEQVYAQTRACFAEMLGRGITCVGEFHYLHHDRDGRPYADPNELSRQVIRAAADVGVRLCLLEVYYARAGFGQDQPLPEQRRFCDGSVDAYLARVDALRSLPSTGPLGSTEPRRALGSTGPRRALGSAEPRRALRSPELSIGVAPHSVRAVRARELAELAAYANLHELAIHAHVSEQQLENHQCEAEHGKTPLELFAETGCLARAGAFTAVHAVHVSERDLERLRGQQVCACPTTEADLGDGIVPAVAWRAHGASLALGSDSNSVIDLIQEARLLEMHERLQHQARLRLVDEHGRVAPVLLAAATLGGARALGRPELGRLAVGSPFDAAVVDLEHPSLRGVDEAMAVDALFLAGTAEPIAQVWVAGKRRI